VGLAYNDSGSDIQGVSSVAFPENDSILLYTGNGSGAVNTAVRRFANIKKNEAASVVYLDSANDGAGFTIAWPGAFEFSYSDLQDSGSRINGIGFNETANPITGQIAEAEALIAQGVSGSGIGFNLTKSTSCKIGDLIRPRPETSFTATTSYVFFGVQKVS
jgi:hypothetical protein